MRKSALFDSSPKHFRRVKNRCEMRRNQNTPSKKNITIITVALDPVSIFGKISPRKDQLFARINDKLNRIKNNKTYEDEGFIDAVDLPVSHPVEHSHRQ